MEKFLLGKKIGMSHIFKENKVIPITVIEAGPCVVTNIKTLEKDKYTAVQIGFGEKNKISKPVYGQVHQLGKFSVIKEFRVKPGEEKNFKIGDVLKADLFQVGEHVNISGISKGKGFAGVVKRHGFATGPRSHGHPHPRQPGSIGSTTPQRVIKGKKMAGRMGGNRVTVKNLEIVDIDPENNLIAVKGSVPGRKGTILEIKNSK